MSEPYYRDEPYLMITDKAANLAQAEKTTAMMEERLRSFAIAKTREEAKLLNRIATLETRNRQLVQAMGEAVKLLTSKDELCFMCDTRNKALALLKEIRANVPTC